MWTYTFCSAVLFSRNSVNWCFSGVYNLRCGGEKDILYYLRYAYLYVLYKYIDTYMYSQKLKRLGKYLGLCNQIKQLYFTEKVLEMLRKTRWIGKLAILQNWISLDSINVIKSKNKLQFRWAFDVIYVFC